MASPQLERGHTRIADELLEAMTRFDFSKRQYKILLAVIRKTYGYQKKSDVISSGQLAKLTGLHSPHCRATVKELADISVLKVAKVGQYQRIELIKDYEKWGRKPVPKQYNLEPPVPKQTRTKTVREAVPKQYGNPYQNGTHNKERKKKQIKPPPQRNPQEDILPPPDFDPGGGSGDFLIIPKALSSKEGDSARQQVAQIRPDQRQAVLDVLAAMITAGEIRKSPLAALGGLIRRYRAGSFDPSPGIHLAEHRQRAARNKAAWQKREAEIRKPPPSVHDIEQARIKLKQFVNPRLVHG